jgi:hypothetical protein
VSGGGGDGYSVRSGDVNDQTASSRSATCGSLGRASTPGCSR